MKKIHTSWFLLDVAVIFVLVLWGGSVLPARAQVATGTSTSSTSTVSSTSTSADIPIYPLSFPTSTSYVAPAASTSVDTLLPIGSIGATTTGAPTVTSTTTSSSGSSSTFPVTSMVATPTPASSSASSSSYPAPMILSVDSSGNLLMRGVVQSVNGDTMAVTSWGGSWTINQAAATFATTADATGAMTAKSINVGDFVGVIGTTDTVDSTTVNATYVRDWTTNPL